MHFFVSAVFEMNVIFIFLGQIECCVAPRIGRPNEKIKLQRGHLDQHICKTLCMNDTMCVLVFFSLLFYYKMWEENETAVNNLWAEEMHILMRTPNLYAINSWFVEFEYYIHFFLLNCVYTSYLINTNVMHHIFVLFLLFFVVSYK